MTMNNGFNIKDLTNDKGNLEITVGAKTYEVREKATDGDIIIYGVLGGVVTCILAPALIPQVIAWTGALGSLYGIAKVLEKK